MARISDDTVAEVRAASDIVDVVSDRVRLKKQGRRFVGLCPFHNEKSPSFSVDADEGLYYCFGCLDEDEEIWTDHGLIRIGDVSVGDRVLGIDGREEIVVDRWDKNGAVRELHFGAVRRDPLRLTGDHVCMVVPEAEAVRAVPMLYRQSGRGVRFQGRRRQYDRPRPVRAVQRLADDVKAGDYVLFPVVPASEREDSPLAVAPARRAAVVAPGGGVSVAWPRPKGPAPVRLKELPVNPRTARMFGLWLAEGSVYRGGVRWSFDRDEEHYARFVVDVLEELGLAATIHRRPERTLTEVTCSNTHLSRLMPRYFGKGAAGKRVPWSALKWSVDVQRALFEGYMDGDAARPVHGQATAVSVSSALVRGLFAIGVQAGYLVSMGKEPYRTSVGRPLWRLSLRSRESVDAFYHEAAGQRAYWLRVSENFRTDEQRTVIDIETTGSHTFTTRVGAVHNCQRGGDTFKFVQETEGVGFLDAVRLLADRAGIEIAEEGADPENDRKATLYAALRFAGRFYFEQLSKDAGARGLEYLKSRGFTPEAVREFGLGVAPVGWDGLAVAARAASFDMETLEAVGLAKSRGGREGHYDVFRDRLMFPILSPIGKVLGFGGRILPDTPTASPDYTPAKYINTPETEVYQKSRVLYGMKQAKRAIRTQREVLVVEGYADVVSLWQAGVQNVVAASGTALTPQQMNALGKLEVQRVVMLFDADDAGRKAARKGVDVALDAGLAPYAVSLPEGADPDSFVRQFGADAFRAQLRDERMDFVDFLIGGAKRDGRLSTPEGTLEATREVVSAIRRVKNPILVDGYLRRAAHALDVPDADLRAMYDGHRDAPRARRQEPLPPLAEAPAPVLVPSLPQEKALLRLMLKNGLAMVEHVLSRMGLDEFSPGPVRQSVEALVAQYHAGKVEAGPFVQGEHGLAVQALVVETLAEQHHASENWERMGVDLPALDEAPFKSADSAMKLMKLARVGDAIEQAKRRVLSAEREGADLTEAQQQLAAYVALRQRIERGELLLGAQAGGDN